MRVAAATRRVLLLHWEYPGNLTDFLVPAGRIDWRLEGTPAANLTTRELKQTTPEREVYGHQDLGRLWPDAKFFAVAFCRHCGSAVPRVSAARNIVSVPAGSLDSEPGIKPTGHIYVDSKAPWFEITGDLPQFAEMPPRR